MEKIVAVVAAVVATAFGYWTQNLVLDEIGLQSLSITEYILAEVGAGITAGAVTVFKIFWGD